MAKNKPKGSNKKKILFIFVVLLIGVFVAVAMYFSLPSLQNQLGTGSQTTTTQATVTTAATTTAGTSGQTPTTVVNTGTFQPSAVTLEIKSWGFNPNTVTLLKGSTATWTNKDSVKHTVTSAGNFDSGDIAAGASWPYTFNKAGTFEYNDKYNPSMKAKVVITE